MNKGFTLIELVVVIVLLGILAVAALPRMISSYDAAHVSAVTATGGALSSAVILLRSQWVSNGANGAVDNVQGYGEDNLATSEEGWPSDAGAGNASKHSENIGSDSARCVRIWRGLLISGGPSVSASGDAKSDYFVASPSGSTCIYSYRLNQQSSRIEYNLQNGSVVTYL